MATMNAEWRGGVSAPTGYRPPAPAHAEMTVNGLTEAQSQAQRRAVAAAATAGTHLYAAVLAKPDRVREAYAAIDAEAERIFRDGNPEGKLEFRRSQREAYAQQPENQAFRGVADDFDRIRDFRSAEVSKAIEESIHTEGTIAEQTEGQLLLDRLKSTDNPIPLVQKEFRRAKPERVGIVKQVCESFLESEELPTDFINGLIAEKFPRVQREMEAEHRAEQLRSIGRYAVDLIADRIAEGANPPEHLVPLETVAGKYDPDLPG